MKDSWQRIWQWLELAACGLDYDPLEALQNRITALEAEVAQIKGAKSHLLSMS